MGKLFLERKRERDEWSTSGRSASSASAPGHASLRNAGNVTGGIGSDSPRTAERLPTVLLGTCDEEAALSCQGAACGGGDGHCAGQWCSVCAAVDRRLCVTGSL